jgi:adenine-specific DNA-methyltransferase
MPSLHWIGKEKVVHHHLDVPYHVLEHSYSFVDGNVSQEMGDSGNKIIHGDNLLALKSLLPQYEGKVNCIYIDPPYNTGNEGWVYNDNVNDPKIKKWLGEVVGKEAEDLTRHDKWLCMMYPRLKLLHKLLAEDGVIFISIDDNEVAHLKVLMDEIFGPSNFVASQIWKKAAGNQNDAKYIAINHEYILCYSKRKEYLKFKALPLPPETIKAYKHTDKYYETRGKFQLRNLNDNSIGDRPGLHYDIECPDGTIIEGKKKQWRCDIFKFQKRLDEDRIVFEKINEEWQVFYKVYLNEEKEELKYDEDGSIMQRGKIPTSILENVGMSSDGSKDLKSVFNSKSPFDYPKPVNLISNLISISTNKNSIILDSFAGSGTTAHAVLNLNKKDGGNRKFILVEMEEYADSITAERVKRVINGYADVEETGGGFSFYTLGLPLFTDVGLLNEAIGEEKIREYIYFTETQEQCTQSPNSNRFFLGIANDSSYYFYYIPDQVTTLNAEFLATISLKSSQYVIYADTCALDEVTLLKNSIIFKKIPRDITRI